jgi:hypothetical protein
MHNTISISLKDWIQVINEEYLSSFVRGGGASIKFAVPSNEGSRTGLYAETEANCHELDYIFVKLNAETMRAHMPQDFFFRIASQVDWRLLARRMILKLAAEQDYQIGGIRPGVDGNVFDAIATVNGLESEFVIGNLRPMIQNAVFRNTKMARDFRVCMSHLCTEEYSRGGYTGEPLLEWLTGENTRISGVRPFSIYTSINRNTARYFIESALYWIHQVGHSGTVVLFDNARVTVARNPRDGLRYYTRAMAMEHYELLREFVDGADRLTSTVLVVVTNSDFLDDSGDRRSRGYGIYEALRTRVMDDVRDRNRVNPVASLVRLT